MLGYSEDEFWRKTPRQIFRVFEAESERQVYRHNERIHLAWHVANFSRAEKLPTLSSQLMKTGPSASRKPFDWRAHKAAMKQYIAAQKVRPGEDS